MEKDFTRQTEIILPFVINQEIYFMENNLPRKSIALGYRVIKRPIDLNSIKGFHIEVDDVYTQVMVLTWNDDYTGYKEIDLGLIFFSPAELFNSLSGHLETFDQF